MKQTTTRIETPRLRLRALTTADADHLFALDNDPDVMRWLNGGAPVTRDHVATVLLPGMLEEAAAHPGFGFFAAQRKDNQHFIGWFSLRPPERAAAHPSFGIRLKKNAWHQGFGAEGGARLLAYAWDRFECSAVDATTYEHNLDSRALLTRLGFEQLNSFDFSAECSPLCPTCVASPGPPWPGKDFRYRIMRPRTPARTPGSV